MQNLRSLRLLVLLTFLTVAAFHLVSAIKGYPLYRDQHVGTALEYSRTGIDLLRPVIIGFNATGTPTILELPLWQAVTALFMKAFGEWLGWGNVVSLAILALGVYPMFQIARAALGERGAYWAVIAFLLQPLVFYMGGVAGTDGLSLVAALWFFFLSTRMLQTHSWVHFGAALVLGILTVLTKLPYFFLTGLALAGILFLDHRRQLIAWVQLGVVGVLATAVFFAWSRHAEAMLTLAEFPLVDLRMSNPEMTDWYFGTWEFRLNPANWVKAGWRALNCLWGSFAIAGFAIAALLLSRTRLAVIWLAAAALTTAVFTHLIIVHSHYYLLFTPAVAILMGAAIEWLESRFEHYRFRMLFPFFATTFLGFGTIQGLLGLEIQLLYDPYPKKVAHQVAKFTAPEERVLIWGGGWGGDVLMLADRRGLSLANGELLEQPQSLARLAALGYKKIVLISESPLLWALQVINPGAAELPRTTNKRIRESLPPGTVAIYEDHDIYIGSLE